MSEPVQWFHFSAFVFPLTLKLFNLLSPSSLQHQCLQGTVCPVAAASTAYCGSCDLDPSTAACTWVLSAHSVPETPSTLRSPSITSTQETLTVLSTHTNKSDNAYKTADIYSHTQPENSRYEGSLCSSHEEVVYSGDASRHTYTGNTRVYVCVCTLNANKVVFSLSLTFPHQLHVTLTNHVIVLTPLWHKCWTSSFFSVVWACPLMHSGWDVKCLCWRKNK